MACPTRSRRKPGAPAMTAALLPVLLLLAIAAAGPAAARDASVFLIRDVAVDASAENATHARDIALADGHAVAFRRLMERIVPMTAVGNVPQLDSGDIAPLVQSFEVDGEKTSRVRYLARLTFQFDRAAVRRFLHGRGVKFAVTRAKPRLVLPVLRMAGAYLLWDRPNPWREAWADLSGLDGLVPLAIPAGDLKDLRDISARQAVLGDPERLGAIAKRYGAGSVAVMVATPGRKGGSPPAITVSTVTHGADDGGRPVVETFRVDPGEAIDGQFRSVASRVARRIQEAWKSSNLLFFDRGGQIEATVPVSGLEEWVAVSRALSDTPSTHETRVISASRDAVRVRLRYFGDADGFRAALRRNELDLRRGEAGWILTRIPEGRGPQPGTPGSES